MRARSVGRARRRPAGRRPASSSALVRPPGPGPTSSTVDRVRSPAAAAIRRRIDGSNRKCWPSRLSARSPWARSCRLSLPPPASGSEPDVDERVPAQVAQVAAGLPLDLLLLDRCRTAVAVDRSPPPRRVRWSRTWKMCTPAGLTIGSETWPTGSACDLVAQVGSDGARRAPSRDRRRSGRWPPPRPGAPGPRSWRRRAAWRPGPRASSSHARLLGAVVDRQQDLAQQQLAIAGRGAALRLMARSICSWVTTMRGRTSRPTHLDPGDLGPQLLAQRARIEAAFGEVAGQSSGTVGLVALRDRRRSPGRARHRSRRMAEPLGLLQLQLLVDQPAQHLRRQALPGRRRRWAGRWSRWPGSAGRSGPGW